ncbi:hypothetical protein [Vibrio parahaemolyticus]|jgi:hypothetical protein|nr:hypothetical protein [Vibrio parahaemolyticus]
MEMSPKLKWSVVAAIALLQGCASNPKQTELEKEKIALQKSLLETLEKYSAKAIEAKEMTLTTQSALLQLDSTPSDIYKITQERLRFAPGLDKPISFRDIQTDVKDPLKLIADLTNYEIDFGSRPAHTTVWVTLAKGQRSAQDWIYDIHDQAKGRISIDIYPNKDALSMNGTAEMGEMKNGKIFVSFNTSN